MSPRPSRLEDMKQRHVLFEAYKEIIFKQDVEAISAIMIKTLIKIDSYFIPFHNIQV